MFLSVFGVLVSVSGCHWLFVWIGFEVNLIGFIPYLINSGLDFRSESGMKYFLVQALGSILFAFGSVLWLGSSYSIFSVGEGYGSGISEDIVSMSSAGVVCVVFSLLLKVGSFPFHYWLPDVVTSNSWSSCSMILTTQKIAPFVVLFSMVDYTPKVVFWLLVLSALGSSFIGGVGGIGESSVRLLMAYSSIGHTGWILFSMFLGYSAFMVYFVVYLVLVGSMFLLLSSLNSKLVVLVSGSDDSGAEMASGWGIISVLLSLGGVPPFLGFMSKWVVISLSMGSGMIFFVAVLIVGSLLSLYYYLVLVFGVFFSKSTVMGKYMHRGSGAGLYGEWRFVFLIVSLLVVNLLGSAFCLFFL
uniref:NADH-ubiquinone oxidoreductase chain 2 n=1 Tax=Iothia sp. TaxID=3071114 RepID=A0AA96HTM3_9GAST|nr:NADH dehydrogenase subunit 2 [Iothia sp.]